MMQKSSLKTQKQYVLTKKCSNLVFSYRRPQSRNVKQTYLFDHKLHNCMRSSMVECAKRQEICAVLHKTAPDVASSHMKLGKRARLQMPSHAIHPCVALGTAFQTAQPHSHCVNIRDTLTGQFHVID